MLRSLLFKCLNVPPVVTNLLTDDANGAFSVALIFSNSRIQNSLGKCLFTVVGFF